MIPAKDFDSEFERELEESQGKYGDEDILSAAYLTANFVKTLCNAFKQRFPVLDGRAVYIVTNSCMLTALNVLLSIEDDVPREMAKEAMLDMFHKLYSSEDLRKHQL